MPAADKPAPAPTKKVRCRLVGCDGNAFSLMGHFSNCARREKWTDAEISAVCNEVMSGDYQNLLRTLAAHCVNGGA